ncbi:short-chain dehydrogenase [Colletotrichum simmondsii]|uniref:Short-chain dehydrogenase n=1 Tax=Colletotrichum simmondsii TaxID=703756 RepID=A0A135TTE2_9PEZI|nr:short-chain dehydrogenase [Colletotrichum simmondsii]
MTFATNHVGHFLLKNRILPNIIKALLRTPSLAGSFLRHQLSKIPEKLPEEELLIFRRPASGRTANILYSISLTQTLEAKYGIGSSAIHPGAVTTNINCHAKSEEIKKALKRVKKLDLETPAKTLDQGVNSSVLSAVGPELPSPGLSRLESKGLYIADCKLDDEQCAGYDRNLKYADKLWALREELVKEKFDI